MGFNSAQIRHISKILSKQHYVRRLMYLLYEKPILIHDWCFYPRVNRARLQQDNDYREAVHALIKYYYYNTIYYNNESISNKRSANRDPFIRSFTFSGVHPCYADLAWFIGVVGNYRLGNGYFRVMVKDLYNFDLNKYVMNFKRIEEHIWININKFKVLNHPVSVGMGDVLVFLAKRSTYHHMNRWRRRSHNIFYRHGVIKCGLVDPILVSSGYPIIERHRLAGYVPYPHIKTSLVSVLKRKIKFGSDLRHKDQNKLKNGNVWLFHITHGLRKKLISKVKTLCRVLCDNCMQGKKLDSKRLIAVSYHRTGDRLRVKYLDHQQSVSLKLQIKMQGKTQTGFYKLRYGYVYPLLSLRSIINSSRSLTNRGKAGFNILKLAEHRLSLIRLSPEMRLLF